MGHKQLYNFCYIFTVILFSLCYEEIKGEKKKREKRDIKIHKKSARSSGDDLQLMQGQVKEYTL